MSKLFKQVKAGDTIFLVGSPDFIAHEDLVENFGLFRIKTVIQTLDRKRNPIVCLGGEYFGLVPDPTISKVAYFTALEDSEINGYTESIRIDEWSEKFTKTISSYQPFLCFQDIESGLDYLDKKFDKFKEDIKESREINNNVLKESHD